MHDELRWQARLDDVVAELVAEAPAGIAAGELHIGGATWVDDDWVPEIGTVRSDLGASRQLLGWRASATAVGVYATVRLSGILEGHAVVRDGTEASVGDEGPFLWMLRRAVGLPSRARCREPRDVMVSRLAAAVVSLARDDPDLVRDAADCGRVVELAAPAAAIGPVSLGRDPDVGWEHLRLQSETTSPLARWCDAELFGFLAGHGTRPAREVLEELDGDIGAHHAALVRDALCGPW